MLVILIVLKLNIFQKKLKHSSEIKTLKKNTFRIQAYYSIICRYFCIRFIDFTLAVKTLTDFANLSKFR